MNFANIQDLIIGYWKSQVLFTALELGIFEELAKGAKELNYLADSCKFSPISGEQLLTACISLGLITKEGSVYKNSLETQQLLVKEAPNYVGNVALHLRDTIPLWNHLTDAVQENSNRWKQVTGSEEGHFPSLYKDPKSLEAFVGTMDVYTKQVAQAVSTNFDFYGYKKILDVGGSTGLFGNIIIEEYPHLNVTIFDLPKVCDITEKYIKNKYHKDSNMKTIRGNFLQESLPEGFDVIYLGWVLHDWPPEIQMQILEKCYQALPTGGVVIATENLLNENKSGPVFTALMSLAMLVATDGGVESTGNEYIERFTKAGFKDVKIKELPSMRHMIIGVHP